MTRAFGFDGDSAAYESLERAVLADVAAKKRASVERRASQDTDEAKKMSRKERKAAAAAEEAEGGGASSAGRKKSIGEKVANFVFNGGRSSKMQSRGEERVGDSKGGILRGDTGVVTVVEGEGEQQRQGGLGLGIGHRKKNDGVVR